MNAVAVKETLAQWRDNLVDYLPGNKIGKLLATGVGLYLDRKSVV